MHVYKAADINTWLRFLMQFDDVSSNEGKCLKRRAERGEYVSIGNMSTMCLMLNYWISYFAELILIRFNL